MMTSEDSFTGSVNIGNLGEFAIVKLTSENLYITG